jgi:hypothetical protein
MVIELNSVTNIEEIDDYRIDKPTEFCFSITYQYVLLLFYSKQERLEKIYFCLPTKQDLVSWITEIKWRNNAVHRYLESRGSK